MQGNYRKQDYFTNVYTAAPYHAQAIREHKNQVSARRRELDGLAASAHSSLNHARQCQVRMDYDNSVADFSQRIA